MSSRLRGRAYLLAKSAERRVGAGLTAAHAGLWLGLLDLEDLHAVDEAHYAAAPRYRDDGHNRAGLFDWEREALAAHFPSSGRVLVLGAGAGREVLALCRGGYDVVGYEPHPMLLEHGRAVLAGVATLHSAARDHAPAGGGPYDAVVIGWGAYMLVVGAARRIGLLRELRMLVPVGAPVLLSFFTRPRDDPRARVVAGVAGAVRRARHRAPVELGDDLAPNALHRFTRGELERELGAARFGLADYREQGAAPVGSGWAVGRALACGPVTAG